MRRSRNERSLEVGSRSLRPIVLVAIIFGSLLVSSQSSQASVAIPQATSSQAASHDSLPDTTAADDIQNIGVANAEVTYTLAEVATRNTQANCWTVVFDKVYNITSYIKNHPGGASSISKICGKDGTSIFDNKHGGSSSQAIILSTYKIGALYKPPATSCDAGYLVSPSQGTCTPATKGYFVTSAASAAGTTVATPCPLGKFTSVTGSTECLPAPPGYFVDTTASTVAKPCQKGYFAPVSGSAQCQIAPKGLYVADTGSSIATACATGLTTTSTGSTASSSCYKPIIQTIPGFSSPKAFKYGASTNLAITTNTKALATYKVSGPCTAKVVSIASKLNGKNVTIRMLKVTASNKDGNCSVTLASLAKDRYLAMTKPVKIQVSKTGK
jgi:cytochrome b involved in lipid metabolism